MAENLRLSFQIGVLSCQKKLMLKNYFSKNCGLKKLKNEKPFKKLI